MSTNTVPLPEALRELCARLDVQLETWKLLGAPVAFLAFNLEADLRDARAALESQNVVEQMRSINALRSYLAKP